MKLNAERRVGSFSRLREKAGDEGAARSAPTLHPSPLPPERALRERECSVSCVAEDAQSHGALK